MPINDIIYLILTSILVIATLMIFVPIGWGMIKNWWAKALREICENGFNRNNE